MAFIKEFGDCRDAQARRDFILNHPVMIHERITTAIFADEPQLAVQYRLAIEVAGGKVQVQGQADFLISFNADRYPVGLGPIEAVWDSLESRIISLGYAIEQVRARRIGELLTYVYVKALCDQCVRRLRSGEWQIALRRQRLIVESTEALRGLMPITSADDVWAMRFAAARSWLEIASRALGDMADPRLLRHAAEIGERLVTEAHQRKDVIGEARLLHRLGALFLDPYTAGRELAIRHNYELALKLWQERLRDGLGRVYDQLPEGDRWMPPVQQALARSEAYLRQALPLEAGAAKAATIAALLQALLALRTLGQKSDLDEMIALAREGLSLLGSAGNDECRIRLSVWLKMLLAERADQPPTETKVETNPQQTGKSQRRYSRLAGRLGDRNGANQAPVPERVRDDDPLVAEVRRLLNTPIEELAAGEGMNTLSFAVMGAVDAMHGLGRNAAGLQLIERFRSLFVNVGHEGFLARVWSSEVVLLRNWLADGDPPVATAANPRPTQRKPTAKDRRIAELLTIALRCGRENREVEGLQALHEALELDRSLLDRHSTAFGWQRAQLLFGEGKNRFNGREMIPAVGYYVRTARSYASLNLIQGVFDCLDKLHDVLKLGYHEGLYHLVRRLEPVVGEIETATGESGTRLLQTIFRRASSLWQGPSGSIAIDEDTIFRTLRLAKGRWLAEALRAPVHFDWREDSEALRQLDAIASLAAQLGLPPDNVGHGDGQMAEPMLIGQAGLHEQRAGSNDEQRYENLRLAFNDYVKRRQAALSDASREPDEALTLAAFQKLIEPDSIVLDYFSGQNSTGEPALYIFAITRDGAVLYGQRLDSSGDENLADGEDPLGRLVLDIRKGITAYPGYERVVGLRAEPSLIAGERQMLGPVMPFLTAQWALGRRHLVVIPHGPLHFLPLHLLGSVDAPIAHDWVVTYLPVASLLNPRAAQHLAQPANRMMVVGLDFHDNAHLGARRIDGAPAFIRRLASAMGGTPLVNGEATKARVTAALQSSRYVHVYTHGVQCAYAAAFHALFIAPGPTVKDDGVLRSYEILPLDCQGLEVLTLSACESALRRFDGGDNLTGLPGSLLLAGVQRIVGCLWPVAASVAELFFLRFYEALHAGKTMRAAFRHAQLTARAEFREYRDWGAFYFMGPTESQRINSPS